MLENSEQLSVICVMSSKGAGIPPEVTSRSRDVNKRGGGVNDLPIPPPN